MSLAIEAPEHLNDPAYAGRLAEVRGLARLIIDRPLARRFGNPQLTPPLARRTRYDHNEWLLTTVPQLVEVNSAALVPPLSRYEQGWAIEHIVETALANFDAERGEGNE
jgi:hypothetical protein